MRIPFQAWVLVAVQAQVHNGAESFFAVVFEFLSTRGFTIFFGENNLFLNNLNVFKIFVKSHSVENSNATSLKNLPQCEV